MNASGITFELYHKIDNLADEWVLKAFMNSFVNVLEDIKKKEGNRDIRRAMKNF